VKRFSDENKIPYVALVNNAGISRKQVAEFHDISDAKDVFETNFFGVLDLVQQSLPELRKNKGRVIMVSSLSGFLAAPLYSVYSGSKFALEGFSDSLRREVAAFGVSVSIVEPGHIRTELDGKNHFSADLPMYTQVGARKDVPGEQVVSIYPHVHNWKKHQKRAKSVRSGSGPEVTTTAILHAIRDQYPKTRYPVAASGGLPTSITAWLIWALPDRIKDALLAKLN
jgi:short-subunit dehydrogenase